MNKKGCEILNILLLEPYISQRVLSEKSGYSLGTVNKTIKALIQNGYINHSVALTSKAYNEFKEKNLQEQLF